MTRDPVADWQELSALYEQAEGLEGTALRSWLEALPAESRRLLAQLERMLGARVRIASEGFLEALPQLPGPPDAQPSEWGEGSGIGPYKLVRHIGSGGMAEVWLADRADGTFERQVAIKLLFNHPTRAQRETFVERFRRERDILASLDHPNIARLHDAGVTPSGQPWLALDFVEGVSINEWCDRERSTVAERVKLFLDVLLAVQHAHANLVIHRDLKPANILVADANVRLLDFGIAKLQQPEGGALADTELTRRSGRPLTLQYASPEQLLGEPLTTASDVYSLGVIFYELLCGHRPYERTAGSAAQMERAILELDPKSLSSWPATAARADARGVSGAALRKVLTGDLDAVVLKAMAKDTKARYPSVESFRSELMLWQAGVPVAATSPSAARRAFKFARRNAVGVGVALVVSLALLTSATVALIMGLKAREEAGRAVAAKDFLVDMFRTADPNRSNGADPTAGEMLATGRVRAATAFANEPELQASVLAEIARIQRNLGQNTAARDTFADVAALYRRSGNKHELVGSEIALSDLAVRSGDAERALQLLGEIEPAVAEFKQDNDLQASFAEVRGWALLDVDRLPAARVAMTDAARYATAAHGEKHVRSADMWRGLAEVELAGRNFDLAIAHIAKAAEIIASLGDAPVNDKVGIELERVRILSLSGRYNEALTLAPVAVAHCDSMLGERAENCAYLRDLQAGLYLRLGQPQRAAEALPVLLRVADDSGSPSRQAEALTTACRVLAAAGTLDRHPDVAARMEALAMSGPERPLDSRLKRLAHLALAEAALYEGHPERARLWVERFTERQRDAGSSDPLSVARARNLDGIAQQMQGEHAGALASFEEADRILVNALGSRHTLLSIYRLNQASSLAAIGQSSRAVDVVDRAAVVMRERVGETAPIVMRAQTLRSGLGSARPGRLGPAAAGGFFI
ncbi:MAG: serine/threonine-protein kinase [Caldimonas sp.]